MLIIEIFAAILTLISVYLTAKRNILSWPIGMLSICLYAIIFYKVKLYADLLLQGFFMVQSIIGCIEWNRNREVNSIYVNKIESLSNKKRYAFLIFTLILYFISAYLFDKFTDASLPYIDSLVSVLSLLATYFLIIRKIESWYIWIFVDIIYVGLFLYKGLFITSVLYFILLILAINGLLNWRKVYIINKI